MGCWKCCCCLWCLIVFAGIFTAIFFIGVSASVNLDKVHHVLQDVEISNVSMSKVNPNVLDSASLNFKVWSRNANDKMGVRIWHMRIAVRYNGYELGRAFVTPAFLLPPGNITILQAPLLITNLTIPTTELASRLKNDIATGTISLRINVKVRGRYKRSPGAPWQTKFVGGELHGDDKCDLQVSLAQSNGTETSLKGRQCGWTLSYYNPGN